MNKVYMMHDTTPIHWYRIAGQQHPPKTFSKLSLSGYSKGYLYIWKSSDPRKSGGKLRFYKL